MALLFACGWRAALADFSSACAAGAVGGKNYDIKNYEG
jgi:hypothetical protein